LRSFSFAGGCGWGCNGVPVLPLMDWMPILVMLMERIFLMMPPRLIGSSQGITSVVGEIRGYRVRNC
jgi:hypothetical protein